MEKTYCQDVGGYLCFYACPVKGDPLIIHQEKNKKAGPGEYKQGVGQIMGAKMWQRKVVSLCLFTV